eukprot:COSAG05_NODE_108_length_18693_cov_7.956709_3_plen_35_part_00
MMTDEQQRVPPVFEIKYYTGMINVASTVMGTWAH